MLKRLSMGLLSAVLLGAMLPGVAGAEDNAGSVGGHATIVGASHTVSYEVGSLTVDAGDSNQLNGQLDIPANSVYAILFDVEVR